MPINNLSWYRNLGDILLSRDMNFCKFAEFAKTFFLRIQNMPFFHTKNRKRREKLMV